MPTIHHGDCIDIMRTLPDNSVDSIITDPPYDLKGKSGKGGFMGKHWDGTGIAFDPETWREALRVLKPGGHLLAFGGTRTWHRLAVAVEDAGFEVRDSIAWMHGQGFPKSLNVSRALDGKRCGCAVPLNHANNAEAESPQQSASDADLHGMSGDVRTSAQPSSEGEDAVLLATMQRGSAGQGVGRERAQGRSGQDCGELRDSGHARGEKPGMEGRRNPQSREGELRRAEVRPLPSRMEDDGTSGRLHHGASASHGSVDGPGAASYGSSEPYQQEPAGQPQGEPGTVPVERGSQARGSWPICPRCSKQVIPDGVGTALKPAFEPVVVARKPLQGTVAGNVTTWGVGGINIDGCRIATSDDLNGGGYSGDRRAPTGTVKFEGLKRGIGDFVQPAGRFPANVILDEHAAQELDQQSGFSKTAPRGKPSTGSERADAGTIKFGFAKIHATDYDDTGGASRFFYSPKASKRERPIVDGVAHPTVKPVALMQYLVRLVTPKGGTVLEPFAGSGTTVEACILEGMECIAIEREAEYLPLIQARIDRAP